MTERAKQIRQEAINHKKEKKYKEAAEQFRLLWDERQQDIDGANLLHCLRKSNQFEDAFKIVEYFLEKEDLLDWIKNEIIWTLLSGKLLKAGNKAQTGKVIEIGKEILALSPDFIPRKIIIFQILKVAKNEGRWDVILDWIDRLNPEELDEKPYKSPNAWSDKTLWFFYKINALINQFQFDKAAEMCDEALKFSEKQTKIFLLLKASAYKSMNETSKALPIYEQVLNDFKMLDWQLLIDYIQLLKKSDESEKALAQLYNAARANKNKKILLKIIQEIAFTALETGKEEIALTHFILEKKIHEEKKLRLSVSVKRKIKELSPDLSAELNNLTREELSNKAESYWNDNRDD